MLVERKSLAMKGGGRVFVPDASCESYIAREDYIGYIQHFFDFDLPVQLFDDQVQALQSLRDVSRAVVERVHKDLWGRLADEIALSLAAWISQDPELFTAIVIAQRNWFQRSRGGSLAASLARMEHWPELKDMAKVCAHPKRNW